MFVSISTQANIKQNRYKYADYVGARYNFLLKTQRVLGDIVLYSTGHKEMANYVTRTFPFPKREALKGGKVKERYYKRTLKLGDKLGAIRDVMNSVFKKWNATHYKNLKALVGEVNGIWTGFGNDMIKTFPKGSVIRGEPPIKQYFRSLETWKTKTLNDLDREE